MKINILVDNKNSWIIPYAKKLSDELKVNHDVNFCHEVNDIIDGDCAFFLSCEKIIKPDILKRNVHNLVVHGSWLPKGKGWSPLTWQILEGENKIPLTLFEAADKVDSGVIYLQDTISFEGHELIDELRRKQGEKTIELVKKFIDDYPNNISKKQSGDATFYLRRNPKDSELDIHKSIAEQFNLLRVVDNDRYPAFFNFLGHKYIIKIEKAEI